MQRAYQKEAEEAKRQAAAEAVRLRTAVDQVLSTESGRAVFQFLARFCGYNRPVVRVDKTGKVDLDGMAYNAAQQAVYLALRGLATPVLLRAVEERAPVPFTHAGDSESSEKENVNPNA